MGFQDVAFLPCRGNFYTTFHKNCNRGLRSVTCPKGVVGVNKGILPVKYSHSNKCSSASVKKYLKFIRLSRSLGEFYPPSLFLTLPDLRQYVVVNNNCKQQTANNSQCNTELK